jgi:hypothetical protein
MTVKLSDEAYGHLMWTMREIACGMARTICEEFNWSYSLGTIKKIASDDGGRK